MLKLKIFLLLLFIHNASANDNMNLEGNIEKTPHYSLGIGLSMFTIDDYIGANESHSYLFPTPYVYYQSDSIVIDRNTFEGDLFESKKWHLSLDAAGYLPVDSDENKAREGMSDLDWVGELGLSLEYYLSGHSRSKNRAYVDFSLRKAISTNFKDISDIGWTGQISLRNEYQFKSLFFGGSTTLDSTAGLLFYSDKYSQYYYSVSRDEANDARMEYDAKGGYAGVRLALGGTWRRDNIWVGLFTRYTYLSQASFEDSPLIKSTSNLLVGVVVSFIFLEN